MSPAAAQDLIVAVTASLVRHSFGVEPEGELVTRDGPGAAQQPATSDSATLALCVPTEDVVCFSRG